MWSFTSSDISSKPLLMRKRYCVLLRVADHAAQGRVMRPFASSANSQPKIAFTNGASRLPSMSAFSPDEMM